VPRWIVAVAEALPLRQLVIVGMITALVLVGLSFARIAVANYQIHQEKSNLQRQVADLVEQNHRLKSQVEYLQTDAAVEALALDELGWTRAGDTVVVVLRDVGTPTPIRR